MASFNEKLFIVTIVAVLSFSGCDALSSKPKNAAPKAVTPAALATPAVQTGADEKLPANVVAKVGGWVLTTADLEEKVAAVKQAMPNFNDKDIEARKMLIDELIRQQLMVQEARTQKLNESKTVRSAVQDFEDGLLVREMVTGLTKNISVTEAEAKDFYDKNPEMFVRPQEKKILEIVTSTEAEAKDVLVGVLQGGNFTQLAKDRSKAKSAANGGDLGFLAQAPFEQMQKAVDLLQKGGVSQVFQGPDGFYVVKVEDVRGGDKVPYAEVKSDLMQGLTGQKQQEAVINRLTEIAQKTKVSVNRELLEQK